MQVTMKVERHHIFILIVAASMIASFGLGVNYARSDPATFGHSAADLNLDPIHISGSNVGIGYSDPGSAKLAVDGNVGIGTTDPGTYKLKVDASGSSGVYIDGTLKMRLNGVVFTPYYANLAEDNYRREPAHTILLDTCDGNENRKYTCRSDESRVCDDIDNTGGHDYSVTCRIAFVFREE